MTEQPTEATPTALPSHTQLFQGLGHQTVDDAMGTAGAVVHRRVGQGRRFLKYNSHNKFFPFRNLDSQTPIVTR